MVDGVATSGKLASREPREAPLVHRGVVIQKPPVAPDTPLRRIRRGARIAVQKYFDELAALE